MNFRQGLFRVITTVGFLISTASFVELYPVQRPITWKKIIQCYSKEIPPGTTFRSIKGEELYGQWKAQMKEKNIKIPEFIKSKILGFTREPQNPIFFIKNMILEDTQIEIYTTGQLQYLNVFLKESAHFIQRRGIQPDSKFVLLTMNNFPYDLEEGVQHWLVWSHKNYHKDLIEQVLKETMHDYIEWQLYENAAHLKSIPEISHYQLFVRKKPEDSSTDL